MRLIGVLLFLPVPLVLWLFTASPFGVGISLVAGVAIMITHRLYARPFALRSGRCLWCGGRAERTLEIAEPGGATDWSICSPDHERSVRRFLGWAWRQRWFLRAGILGAIAGLLIAQPLTHSPAVAWAFRGVVALVVLPLGWLGPSASPTPRARSPFPVHLQALIGSRVVVWLFRIVGALWLVGALRYFFRQA